VHKIVLADFGTVRVGGAEGKESARIFTPFLGIVVGEKAYRATRARETSQTQVTIGCDAGEVKGGRDGKRKHSRSG
jgi:hypothetical protein